MKKNIKGLVGGPLLVGGLGPGPPGIPLNPALLVASREDVGRLGRVGEDVTRMLIIIIMFVY